MSKEELDEILTEQHDARQQRVSGRRLGEILIQRGLVTPAQVAKLVAEQYELPYVDFDVADIDLRVATVLSEHDARRFSALPISRRTDGTYLLGIADPSTVLFSEELRALLGTFPRFVVVGPDVIERAIDYVYTHPVVLEPTYDTEPAQEDVVVLDFPSAGTFTRAFEERDLEVPRSDIAPLLGALLVRDGFLGAGELEAALAQQRLTPHRRLGEILVERGIVTPAVIARLVAEQYELRYFDLGALEIDLAVASRLPADVARRLVAVPIAEHDDGSLDVAISDPTVAMHSDELQRALGAPLTIVMASPEAILAILDDVQAPSFAPLSVDTEGSPEAEGWVEEDVPAEIVSADMDPTREPEETKETSLTTATEATVELEAVVEPTTDAVEDDVDVVDSRAEFVVVEPRLTEIADEPADDAAPPAMFTAPAHSVPDDDPVDDDPVEAVAMDEDTVDDDAPVTWLSPVGEASGAGAPSRWRVVDEPEVDESTGALDEWWDDAATDAAPELEADALVDSAALDDDPEAEPSVADVEPWAILDDGASRELQVATEPPVVEEEPAPPVELVSSTAEEEPTWFTRLELVDEVAPSGETDEPEATDDSCLDLPFMAVLEVMEETSERAAEEPSEQVVEEPSEQVVDEPIHEAAREPIGEVVEEPVASPAWEPIALASDEVSIASEDEPGELEPESSADPVPALDDALAAGATTLHFSPAGPGFAVRARIDGTVTELGTVSRDERDAVLARLAADGIARTYAATTSRGEKTTVFVRDRSSGPRTLDHLSSDPTVAEAIRAALSLGTGAILVCGPPGSGTTTTLYAAVQELAAPDRIVTTVEHPVERVLEDVDQIEVNPAQGATYASVLHAVRLTDPDALMVGDVFDRETAELALREAREGRLVLAGFHAPSAAGAIRRLAELGIEPTALATSVDCIVAQRLVRTVCPDCRDTYYASEDEFELLGLDEDEGPRLLSRGTGCETCSGTGVLGRTAIFEVLAMTDEIRELVAEGSTPKKIQRAAVSGGMRTLRDQGVRLCLEGTASVSELERALGL